MRDGTDAGPSVVIGVPVKNPGSALRDLLASIAAQSLRPAAVVLADSSRDSLFVSDVAQEFGVRVLRVAERDFDHGRTRNLIAISTPADIHVYMTQDAVLSSPDSLRTLVTALQHDASIGVAFGHQTARAGMSSYAHHSRRFSYPDESYTWKPGFDVEKGRRFFCSNVFAAWRADALKAVGGFCEGVIAWEDTLTAARVLEKGWAVHYAAAATAIHSHDYTLGDEFLRYFDMGVVHATQPWFVGAYDKAHREGRRFIASEIRYCRARGDALAAPRVLLRNGIRWLGYRFGGHHSVLPPFLRRALSHNKAYWDKRSSR